MFQLTKLHKLQLGIDFKIQILTNALLPLDFKIHVLTSNLLLIAVKF